MTDPTLRERLTDILDGVWHSRSVNDVVPEIESLCQEIAREAVPKPIRVRSSPNNEDRRMRAMWNRGYNRAIEDMEDRIAVLTHKPQGDSRE